MNANMPVGPEAFEPKNQEGKGDAAPAVAPSIAASGIRQSPIVRWELPPMLKLLLRSKALASALVVLAVAGGFHFYTNRTVEWEEEVPLNTGETIWITRSVKWELQGGAGNPFDVGIRPNVDAQVLRFVFRGKTYQYSGGANVRWIAISRDGVPNLVARSSDYAWDARNSFFCVTPQYVQLVPADEAGQWRWPTRIEDWLYGLEANVMANIPTLDESRLSRYSASDRKRRDRITWMQIDGASTISQAFKSSCISRPQTQLPKR